ncbi:glycosyltransferase family 4 protein [Flavitalea sp. BT771]|uniref:glycosyltransferase family 4 protein n=1 Tax=Flavitalea sp. BT771 TaxID=3063329 RepID=UPI0026E37DB3|nr:glycosyltransferase family 4 protein [Flavitalea sp. BT771]MDO6435544.1 glycosyltransferase family 4 protein [Flavitalea sp. BT771]MDV6224444.1 glycosyltransferase family 4 protein [Flavitalea sp. BT771]
MRVALVTNMPAPYRVPGWNIIHRRLQEGFKIFFCTRIEPNRKWNIPPMQFQHVFLEGKTSAKKDGATFVHNNWSVFAALKAYRPDVVITGGFNPTMLYAFLYCRLHGAKHIPISDAWALSEPHLSWAHKMVRRLVYGRSAAFIACSEKGSAYYQTYGVRPESIFISHYTITNELFSNTRSFQDRKYDLLFSGQFTERKNPLFFIQVAALLAAKKKDLRVLLLGDGPLKDTMFTALTAAGIDFDYGGYARQEELPAHYASSRLFLFPTAYDAWGVVANEAAAAGTPVLLTPYAGCAEELIKDGENGYIIPLQEEAWAERCLALLHDEKKWTAFSSKASTFAQRFTHERAATALIDACTFATQDHKATS